MKPVLRRAEFLNMAHPAWMRWPLGLVAALFTLATTFEPVLAREMARRIIRQDELHRASRRLSFYARRSWLKLNLSNDMVYVFCNQMREDELVALRRFLLRREKVFAPGLIACDLAYVSAMQAIVVAENPRHRAHCAAALDQFQKDANACLNAIHLSPANLIRQPDEKDRAHFALDRAAVALADFASEMRRLDQSWFVLSGTLLGIVREGGFLKHDYDIDAGIMAKDANPQALRDGLNASGIFRCGDLEMQTTFEPKGTILRRPVFMKVSHRNGIYIDIFIHYHEMTPDGRAVIWHASSLFRWDNSDFDLAQYRLADTPVLGPSDSDRYLTENYGNWRIPVTEFNSALDTTNQSVVRNPLSVAIFLRRIWMARRTNPEGAETLLRALERGGFIQGRAPMQMNPDAFN
ncbi:hypothetical protein [Tabrizicola sp.]|uniref:hypothetical protein n=1 Tax=Tabrizicola sp. TaxID=2005166 RepID=UPI003D2BF253